MATYRLTDDQGNSFELEGPEDATDAELEAAIAEYQASESTPTIPTKTKEPEEGKGKKFARRVAQALPIVGGIAVPAAAAIGTGGLSLPATAGLAAAGGAAGQGVKEAILSAIGDQRPTLAEATGRVARTAAIEGGTTLIGGGLFKGAGAGFKAGKRILFSPGKEAAEAAVAAEIAPFKTQATKLAEEIAGMGDEAVTRKRAIEASLEKSGPRIGEIEKSLGIAVDILPEERAAEIASQPGRDQFMRMVGELAKKTPEELRLIPAAERNILRKMGEEVVDKGGRDEAEKLVTAQFDRGLKKIGDSLDLDSPDLGAARSAFKAGKEELKKLPELIRQKASQLRQQKSQVAGKMAEVSEAGAKKVAQAAKDAETRKRLLIGALTAAGLGGTGLGVAKFLH